MNLAQVENGQIVKYTLPKIGTLKDGSTVSGYDILMLSDHELAKQEGWLPLEDNPPIHDEKTQYLINDGYEILSDKVIKKYKIEDIPEYNEPELIETIDDYVLDIDYRLSLIELNL